MSQFDELRAVKDLPVIVADERGLITEVNEPFCSVFGWSRAEIVARPLSSIIPPDLRDAHHLGFSRFLVTGQTTILGKPLPLKAVRKDGSVFEAEHVIAGERRDGVWVFAATIRPLGGA